MVGLLLIVLGCACPNSTSQNSKTANINQNTNTNQTVPSPSATVSSTPFLTDLSTSESLERIKRGEVIYKRVSARTGVPIMFGWRARDITIPVSIGDWNGLTKQQQIDLTYYIEHLVDEIKANPAAYVTRWANYYKKTEHLESGGEYDGLYESSYLQQVRNLCRTCWSVTIGKAKSDGFYDESTPVSGGTVQKFRASAQKD